MATVTETIPELLQPQVDAALDWFNLAQVDTFEVTGIVDAQLSLDANEPRHLRLVLCGGDTGQQKSFLVTASEGGFNVSFSEQDVSTDPTEPQAELDPPPGARRAWLDSALNKHKFVVLVFYRGFW